MKFTYHRYQRNCSLAMVTACQASGKRPAEWCREQSISGKIYSYHLCKLRREGQLPLPEPEPAEKAEPDHVTFCEVVLETDEKDASQRERGPEVPGPVSVRPLPAVAVEYGRFRIGINEGTSKEMIQNVLEVIAHV